MLTRQKTDEDIKKLYGIRKVDRETKHLDIMIESAYTTASLNTCHGKKNHHRPSSSQHSQGSSVVGHADTGKNESTQKLIAQKAIVSPEMRLLLNKA